MTKTEIRRRWRKKRKAKAAQAVKDAAYTEAQAKREAVIDRLTALPADPNLGTGTRFLLVILDPSAQSTTWSPRGMNRTNPANHYLTETRARIAANLPPVAKHALVLCWATQANVHIR